MTTVFGVSIGAALIAGFAAGLLVARRDREHRQRVTQLFDRIEQLEVLVAQSHSHEDASTPPPPTETVENVDKTTHRIRGKLSTLVSSLLMRSESSIPEPGRLDVRTVGYIREHLDRSLTPAQLASGLNVSLRTLQRRTKTSLGCSPRELIIAVKMYEAKRMLAGTDQLVATVARAVGFEDASYFSKRFKAYYGFLPSQLAETK